MWVGLRGAMSWNATTSSSSTTVRDGSSPRTIRQNRQSARAIDQEAWAAAPMGCGGRDRPRIRPIDAVARVRVDRIDGDAGDDVLEVVRTFVAGRRGGDERVVRRVADPAAVGQACLEQHLRLPPDVPGRPARAGVGGERQQLGRSALLRRLVDLAGHPRRRGAGPRRVPEDVQPREIEGADERDRPAPGRVVLGREADDRVRVDRDAGECRPDPPDDRGIVGRQVAPAHPAQHAVVARLERQVDVRQGPRRAVGPDTEQLVVDVLRLDRGDPDPLDRRSRRGSAGRARRGSGRTGRASRGSRARTSRRRRSRR